MRFIRSAVAALVVACLAFAAPAFAADNYTVTVGSGKTMACKDIAAVCYVYHITTDPSGNPITPAQDATVAAINTILGAVSTTPTANTIADRLKTINTTLASGSTAALQGAQGTGAAYNPPTGGSGELGYLSGMYAAMSGTGSTTDKSGTVTTGGAAQAAIALNTARKSWCIQNPPEATENMSVRVNGTASATTGTRLTPGQQVCNEPGLTDTAAVSVFAATTGHAWTGFEIQ